MNSDKQKETVYDKLNNEQKAVQIPYFVHEGVAARMERTNKRLWITVILLIVLLVGTNAGWIIHESQFSTYEVSQEVDTGEGDAYVAGVGDVNYGEGETSNPR